MARVNGSLKLSSNIEVQAGAPLDARQIVPFKSDLTAEGTFPYSYVGMIVVVQDEGNAYILTGKPTTTMTNWSQLASSGGVGDNYYTKDQTDEILANGYYTKTQVDAKISSVYKPAGSATLATLPTLGASVLGNVYNMTEAFTTTADFVEGAGKQYGAGVNVVVVDIGDFSEVTPEAGDNPSTEGWYELVEGSYVLSEDTEVDGEKTYYEYEASYKFDVMAGIVDLSGYQTKMQVTTLPVASLSELGKIYQYVGTTDGNLVNGYFYECREVSPATDPVTYEWVKKNIQDMSGTGELADALTVTKAAGGIDAGTTYNAGTVFEKLWRDLLNPLEYPSFTSPSVTIATTTSKLLEKGASLDDVVITATFNRGTIAPAYGTSGYRSGEAETYALNGGTAQAGSAFTTTVDDEHDSFTVEVAYAAGEQPKDSSGANYSTPLPAGTVSSSALTFEFVNAIWANTGNITAITKQDLVSASAKVKAFTFPAATIANPEVFDVPASWTITAVEVLNTLANTWEDCSSEFTITNTTHDDAGETSTNYKRYTCNLGYDMASRQIRVKWS